MDPKPLPSIFIPIETINKRVGLYRDDKYKLLNGEQTETRKRNVAETKSVWYSKEQVATWLDEMSDHGADGLRFYFGQIEEPEANTINDPSEPLPGQLCLVIMLTRKGSYDGSHVNIVYEKLQNFDERKQLAEKQANETPRQFNFGNYCPPACITEGDDFPFDSLPLV